VKFEGLSDDFTLTGEDQFEDWNVESPPPHSEMAGLKVSLVRCSNRGNTSTTGLLGTDDWRSLGIEVFNLCEQNKSVPHFSQSAVLTSCPMTVELHIQSSPPTF
jgi:hypothetical protein